MSRKNLFDALGRASTLGLHLVSGMLVGGVLGYGLDSWLGSQPWGLLVFLLMGIIAGFRNVWRDAQYIITDSNSVPMKKKTETTQKYTAQKEKH